MSTCQGSIGLDKMGTAQAFTGGTAFTNAGMMMVVVGIKPTIAVVAKVRLVEECSKGTASAVMAVFLDESDDVTHGMAGVLTKTSMCGGSMETTLI